MLQVKINGLKFIVNGDILKENQLVIARTPKCRKLEFA